MTSQDITERSWPADRVERRNVADLIPYARNARTHSDEQVGQIAASIREWGWTTPVLVDEAGMIIAGHGRVMAAQRLGIATVPVMVAKGWSDAQKRAYVLADNKLALNAGWDAELLKVEIGDLDDAGFDLALTGFDGDELVAITADVPDNAALGGLDGFGNNTIANMTIVVPADEADDLKSRLKEIAANAPDGHEAPDGWALAQLLDAYQ